MAEAAEPRSYATAAAPAGGALAPVPAAERVELVDVLRGFALLGILLINVQVFAAPLQLWFSELKRWPGPLDRTVEILVRFSVQGKFYTLFSLLFGLGLAIQMQRAEERGAGPAAFVARRLGWLLAIGLVHAFLIWMGDILVVYAVLGFLLIPFRGRRVKTLAIWAGVLLALPPLVLAVPTFLVDVPGPGADEVAESIESALAAYSSGDLGRIFDQRAHDVLMVWAFSFMSAPSFLGLFLLGAIAGRLGRFRDAAACGALARRWLRPLAAIGVLGNLVLVVAMEVDPRPFSPVGWIGQLCATLGLPAMALAYVAAIVLLVERAGWRRRLAPLAAVGRMALSNYLLQSLVCTAIFNGYGWIGLYGRVSIHQGVLLAIAVFALQVPWSNWWLRRYRFGPLEWVWRSLAYGRRQPLRLEPAAYGATG